ncbi:hypothetical protein IMZ48_36770 [Candidatus Bathyarchaeota archaeon]|nr:hypothetical protein [Candidatus Bathyarchaeota archaeon]
MRLTSEDTAANRRSSTTSRIAPYATRAKNAEAKSKKESIRVSQLLKRVGNLEEQHRSDTVAEKSDGVKDGAGNVGKPGERSAGGDGAA